MSKAADWNDLRYFLAIQRSGTLAGAARELKVDQTTVGRRLAALEQTLGARMFDRTPDGLVLTSAGEHVAEGACEIEERMHGLEARVSGEDARVQGTVRIATSETLALAFVLEELATLRESCPGIDLEIVTGPVSINLLKREADLALRVGPAAKPSQQNLVAKKVADVAFGLYATRAYLGGRPPPRVCDGLAGHDVVGYEAELAGIPPAAWLAETATAARTAVRLNSILGAGVAAASGVGLGALPCFIAALHPSLERALPEAIGSTEIWMVVHPDLHRTGRVRAVLDHITRFMQRNAAFLRGEGPRPR
jgi:DNA-binding transcriptional LysR family regulator